MFRKTHWVYPVRSYNQNEKLNNFDVLTIILLRVSSINDLGVIIDLKF